VMLIHLKVISGRWTGDHIAVAWVTKTVTSAIDKAAFV